MSSVLDRDALAASPLADLHLLANELGVDGFRRLRRDDLIDAIIARQAGQEPAAQPDSDPEPASEEEEPERKPRRGRRGGRGRTRRGDGDSDAEEAPAPAPAAEAEDRVVEGVVELLAN